MTFRSVFVGLVLAAGVGVGAAGAGTVNLATGLNGSGTLQSAGDSLDANWSVTNADNYLTSAPNAYVVASNDADWYGGWVANGPNSDWIAADPNNTANGNMTFTLTFNVSDPATASITGGYWTIDDEGTLTLNGNVLSTLGNGNWGSLNAFTTTPSDFVVGVNTLVMQGGPSTDNYLEGGRLEGILTTSVPEPATWAMMLVGFFGLGAALRGSRGKRLGAALTA